MDNPLDLSAPVESENGEPFIRHWSEKPPVPSIWLFGKAQSGKTSIIRYLTGAEQAVIGNGFQPETKTTFRYTFPSEAHPVMRFFDTRGLGEATYDPTEDIDALEDGAHAVIVTVRINDFALESLMSPLQRIRAARRSRPVILALTCLHYLYPQSQHPKPDPFWKSEFPTEMPEPVRRCLREQREQFGDLVDRVVPIDLTKPEEGFTEPNFGGDRLQEALIELLPRFVGEAILHTDETLADLRSDCDEQAMRLIRSHCRMAAGLGAIPIPWIDIATVTGLQLRLITRLAAIYDQPPLPAALVSGLPVLGSRFLLREGARSLLKSIPLVGIPVNAATAYVTTLGLGRAASWYYWQRLVGRIPSSEEFNRVVGHQVSAARTHWNRPPLPADGDRL